MFSKVKPLDEPEEHLEPEIPKTLADLVDLSEFELVDLLTLRDRINEILPPTELSELNLAEELMVQYQRVKNLQTTTLNDRFEQAQKKAAVVRACEATLRSLINMQTALHTAERFKAIEGLMVRYMKLLPKEVADQFIESYENLSEFDMVEGS